MSMTRSPCSALRTSICRVRIALLCCCVLTSAPLAFAQAGEDEGVEDEGAENEIALEAGAWALQFQVTPDFTLGSFQGSTLSAKRQLSSESALRFGATLRADYQNRDEEVDGEERPFDESANSQFINLSAQYLEYTPLQNDVVVYYGAGPELGFTRDQNQEERTDRDRASTTTMTGFSVGVLGALGVEWFVRSNISLTAEYNASTVYTHRRSTNLEEFPSRADVEQTDTTREVRLRALGVRFGASVYF